MFKNLSDNLNMLMAKSRLSSSDLAKRIGIPATTIKRIRNNEQSNPTISTLLPIANYFSITINDLLDTEPLQTRLETHSLSNKENRIPVLSWNECLHYDLLNYSEIKRTIATEKKLSLKGYALKLENHDLTFFPPHSYLIVEPKIEPRSGDFIVIAKLENGIATIKKYIEDIDKIYLKSLIDDCIVTPLAQDHQILGIVIQSKQELKLLNEK